MKKETIFKHELNESIQANAALNCLKNRNKHKQINEVAPVVATAGRMLLPMLRPIITKLVQKALVKIGTHARPTQVIKLVMDMLIKGEFAKKMAEKCGQTWNEIPSDVKKEIQDAIIDAFKKQAPQEQEEEDVDDAEDFISEVVNLMEDEGMIDDSQWDEAYYTVEEMVQSNPELLHYPSYMQFLNVFGDDILSKLNYQEQEEEDYTNDEIPSPNFSYRMSFMVWAMRQIIPYLKEISQVCAQADPTELKHAVMKILKTRDTGIPETPRSCQEWAKENYDWVEMELNGEYDAYQEKWSKPFNIPSEQEETTDEKGAFALKLVKKFKNRMTPDYAKRPEMFMMLKLQNALKKPLMSLSKEEYRAWAKAICDACESVFGTQEQEELTVEQEEEDVDLFDLAVEIAKKNENKIARLSELNGVSILMRELCKLTNRDYDTLDDESDFDKYRDAAAYGYYSVVSYDDEEEEDDMTASYQAYYSQDEPDYENDHHGIWLIINLMRKQGLLRAQGIEGRDDVDDGHAIDKAYDLIEQKLNEEGMWIGDDDNEAERFVSFYGDEIAAEAMKSAIHNQEQEESFDDADDFISNVVNLMEDEGMIDNSQWDEAYYTIEVMIQSNPNLLQYPSFKQFLNVFADDILRKMKTLALTQYLDEVWIDASEDGDLDELYYAVAKVLDKTGDYPASTNWEDCKPWCEKYCDQVEKLLLGGSF